MKHHEYWHWKAADLIAQQDRHLEHYHDSVFDIPVYVRIFWYGFLSLILPRKKCVVKDESTL